MYLEEFLTVVEKYSGMLPVTGRCRVPAEWKCGDSTEDELNACRHVQWMLGVMALMSEDKCMRWLCFVQGVMWSFGHLTIAEAKVDNYRILNGCDPEEEGAAV